MPLLDYQVCPPAVNDNHVLLLVAMILRLPHQLSISFLYAATYEQIMLSLITLSGVLNFLAAQLCHFQLPIWQ